MASVNEKSTAYLTVSFYDKDNNLNTPSVATWRVDDVGSGQSLLPVTNITPLATSVELILTPTINTFLDNSNKEETRRVTISASGTGYMVHADYDYDILNLAFA